MFSAWCGPASRPTMDIDLLGKLDNSLEVIITAIKHACQTDVEDDGITFDGKTVEAIRITEDAQWQSSERSS